jgi:hypothetical protein
MRALPCHGRYHEETQDESALFGKVRVHLIQRYPTLEPADKHVWDKTYSSGT